ncbi:hypothetical protein SeLEV6574_g08587 [Synchytrium endobioticum]|uniref:RING-type E3 ubiquitin transferase n=1 Tax=Synchytrium endobioticum TaxID=286115 RepID=A0A507BJM4_9FUNG|nr:hypothetical protein SeLEV6574_g08587 [Synchytrium endobioticum]
MIPTRRVLTPRRKQGLDIGITEQARGSHRSGIYVKLKGTAEAGSAGKLIKAPLSGFDCVFVRTSYLGNRVRFSSDIQAHEREEVQEIPWGIRLSDDSRIGVITSGADLVIDGTVQEQFISESVIQNLSPVIILGWVKEATPNVCTVSKPMLRWFLISTSTEDDLIQKYNKWWYIWSATGVLSLVVGAVKALHTLQNTDVKLARQCI